MNTFSGVTDPIYLMPPASRYDKVVQIVGDTPNIYVCNFPRND